MNLRPREKWPRQYAEEIVALTTIDARQEALARVPERLRGLAECHVNIWTERQSWIEARRILQLNLDLNGRRAAIAALPEVLREPVKGALSRMWRDRHAITKAAGHRGGVR